MEALDAACAVQLWAALQANDAAAFVAACKGALRATKSAFPLLRAGIGELLQEALAAPGASVDEFVLSAVEEALDNAESTSICHLILDTLGDLSEGAAWASRQPSPPAAAAALLLRAAQEQPRLAPKVAATFALRAGDLTEAQSVALLDAISAQLDASGTSASGVALLMHFGPPVASHFHVEAILEDLVLSSQDPVALRMVQGSRQLQVNAMAEGGLTSAAAASLPAGCSKRFLPTPPSSPIPSPLPTGAVRLLLPAVRAAAVGQQRSQAVRAAAGVSRRRAPAQGAAAGEDGRKGAVG